MLWWSFFFADDIILIASSERKMKTLLYFRHVFCWANKNEMSFNINKCDTMLIKPLNFVSYPGYEEPYISPWYVFYPLKHLCIFT